MTTLSVGQAGAEALLKIDTIATVSQAGVEVLYRVGNELQVSQTGIEVLHRVTPLFSISQTGVEYLHKSVPCGTRWAQIWKITRTDGEVYRFTSLDRDLVWFGETYGACQSLDPSASENVSEINSAGTMDLSGAIGTISEHDLYSGLFDNATVEAWLVPWSGEGSTKRLLKGTFGTIEQTPSGFKVELLGDGAKLQQTPLVRLLQPGCRWKFGDNHCQKDLSLLMVTGTVDSAIGQRSFVDAARGETAGYFSRGEVTFTTGDNAGITAEIKEHTAGGNFSLWPRLQFAISAGDQYEMTPGCTLLKTADGGTNGCTAWANLPRYGGFDKVPGGDKRSTTPSAK